MKRKIFLVIIMLGLLGVLQAKSRPRYGLFGTIFTTHSYSVYFQDRKENAERPDTKFAESDFFFSLLFSKNTEINIFARKFNAENTFIEGGIWNTSKYLIGLSVGKALTLKLAIPDGLYSEYAFPIDFSIGPYIIGSLEDKYTFISGRRNNDVITDGGRFSYGIYTIIRLRLEFLKEKFKFPAALTIGLKYHIPFNNFEYCRDPNASYRLQRKMFFIGFYI